jgi:thiol-disulfide isomerase/thioredoxin
MKRLLVLTALIVWSITRLGAQGISFFQGTWEEAKAQAKAEGKLIFADAYAAWCGPCKRMAAQTFPDPDVGAFFNANFISVKYDMEKPENAEFARAYPVRSYPTLLFIDGEGKIVGREVGARDPKQLIDLGRKVLGSADDLPEMEAKYNDGSRDPDFMYRYVKALNRAGKPSLKYTNAYLDTQKDLSTPFNLRFLMEGTTEADSRVFDLLLKHKLEASRIESPEAVNRKLALACEKTVLKAIEFSDPALLVEAKDKMGKALPEESARFNYRADTRFFASTQKPDAYLKAAQAYQKAEVKGNASKLNELVVDMMRSFPKDKNILKQAEKWAKTAAEAGGLAEYHMSLAGVYKQKGEKDLALKSALTAKKALSEEEKQHMGPRIDSFIRSLDAQ